MIYLSATENRAAERAAEVLRTPGAVLAVPTETVYGLVCSWEDPEARQKIYALKHRAENKPFAAFVSAPEQAEKIAGCPLPPAAKRIAERFMPGPVTLIVTDSAGKTFGFRIPDHPFIQTMLNAFGKPLASTSANYSGTPAALTAADAVRTLDGTPAAIVDGGNLHEGSMASTIILVQPDNTLKILRKGPVSEEQIRRVAYPAL